MLRGMALSGLILAALCTHGQAPYPAAAAAHKHVIKILPIGNSITNGTSTYNSYRRELWKLLVAQGYAVDFIGSWNKHHGGGPVPDPDFDTDHEGHSGWTAADIFHPPSWDSARGNIYTWLNIYTPDMVLVELGTNDVFQCRQPGEVIADFDTLLDILRKKNKRVSIFLSNVLPMGPAWATKKLCGTDLSYAADIAALNKQLKTFAAKKHTRRSPVKLVDQFSAIDPAAHLYDDIHPNNAGEKQMAEKWFAAIRPYLKKVKNDKSAADKD